jgi:hypothetical protein
MGKNKRIKALKKAIKPVVDRMPVIMDQSYEWQFLSVEEYMEMFDLTKDKLEEVGNMFEAAKRKGHAGIPIKYPLQIARNHSSRMVDAFKKGGSNAVNAYINQQVKIYQDYQAAKG